jgi:hypothetical protein
VFWNHFAFPLVVDTCVLQPPIATSSETASASQVLLKGPVVRVCWCTVRVEPWVFPCANKRTSPKLRTRILALVQKTGWEGTSLPTYTRFSLEEFIRSYTSG